MNKKRLSLYGLKFNPFSPEVPATALWKSPAIESFIWRIEQQIGEGGFSLVSGAPGTGKSVALRLLAERLACLRDVALGVLARPQASVADFYRELGHLFSVSLSPHNRWASAKSLREKWHHHIESSLFRPVLIIDEAQEMNSSVFSELRLLASTELDSQSILTVILAGDDRLTSRLEKPDLLPITSRIRSRLRAQPLSPKELAEHLSHLLQAASNPKLLAPSLTQTLCEHAAGNLRLLMNMANELLSTAVQREIETIDEKLYFEVFSGTPKTKSKR